MYKAILKPVWAYGIHLEILKRFQSKMLRIIVNAPWYVPDNTIQRDIPVTTIKETIKKYSKNYRERLAGLPNKLANQLFVQGGDRREILVGWIAIYVLIVAQSGPSWFSLIISSITWRIIVYLNTSQTNSYDSLKDIPNNTLMKYFIKNIYCDLNIQYKQRLCL